MHSDTTQRIKPAKTSLTDQILSLCASGRFGVREAIAAATKPVAPSVTQPEEPVDAQTLGEPPANRLFGQPVSH